jgi:PAP2 superfamily
LHLLVRAAVWNDRGRRRARANARRIAALERRLGLDWEPCVQAALLPRRRLVHGLNVGYAVFNVGVTVGALIRLYRRGDPRYQGLRRAVLAAHLAAQPLFLLFPAAPPRALDDYVDTLAAVSGLSLDHPLLVRLYNPLAAMPSMHVALALLTARSFGRVAALGYPPLVGLVVVGTGNHFLLDVAADSALARLSAIMTA